MTTHDGMGHEHHEQAAKPGSAPDPHAQDQAPALTRDTIRISPFRPAAPTSTWRMRLRADHQSKKRWRKRVYLPTGRTISR